MLVATAVGRVVRDAEARAAGSSNVANFTVATDHGFGDRKTTTFTSVAVWGKESEWVGQNIKKGDRVAVSGNAYLRKWEKDGKSGAEFTIESLKVEKLWDKKEDSGGGSGGGYGGGGNAGGGYGNNRGNAGSSGGNTDTGNNGGPPYEPDSEIPF